MTFKRRYAFFIRMYLKTPNDIHKTDPPAGSCCHWADRHRDDSHPLLHESHWCCRRRRGHGSGCFLSPERDFKSLVSASLRQIQFSFVVSFDFSLQERFPLRKRERFAFFDKIILPPFLPHVNHVKLFHLVVLDLRSVRDPGLPPGRLPCPDALLRCLFC